MSFRVDRRAWLQAMATAAVSSFWPRPARSQSLGPTLATVAVAPLGAFPRQLLREIDAALRAELGTEVVTLAPTPLPRSAYYPPRRRYRADRLLDFLRPRLVAPATRILGVTQVDISTSAHGAYDWGVLGLGDLAGTACVISTFRCRRRAQGEANIRFRMVTTCVHEVGHTLGLEHCPDPRCLMTDARGSVFTVDHTTGRLCAACRRRLGLPVRAGG